MKTPHRWLALAWLGGALLTSTLAVAAPVQATVTALKGRATIRPPSGPASTAAVGQRWPEGTVIVTAPGARLTLQPHAGIAVVLGGSTVVGIEKLGLGDDGVRQTMLQLHRGSLATALDPAHRSVNDYGVRTTQGVARAHGTTLTVSVADEVYTVSVLDGEVSVHWGMNEPVRIVGRTPSDVTSYRSGETSTITLGDAVAAQTPGLPAALVAAAAAVASIATNPAQVTAVIEAIAKAEGAQPGAGLVIAHATAAAVVAGAGNAALVGAAGDVTGLAANLTSSAVASAVSAGSGGAAGRIANSVAHAVVTSVPGTDARALAGALAGASNAVAGNPVIDPAAIVAGVGSPSGGGTDTSGLTPATSFLDVTVRSASGE
ncbi:MAG: hypothetical protein C0502_01540 [Opitutus sp.]|nr:hypothetical protein [Opitutus sp.]